MNIVEKEDVRGFFPRPNTGRREEKEGEGIGRQREKEREGEKEGGRDGCR